MNSESHRYNVKSFPCGWSLSLEGSESKQTSVSDRHQWVGNRNYPQKDDWEGQRPDMPRGRGCEDADSKKEETHPRSPVLALSYLFLAYLLAFSWWHFGLSHWSHNPETLVRLGIRHRNWYFAMSRQSQREAEHEIIPWNDMLTEQFIPFLLRCGMDPALHVHMVV